MGQMNKRMNLPALQQIMKEFEKQNAKMDQVENMMGDAMDDIFEVRF
jgi:charged multivesicular body protein 2A